MLADASFPIPDDIDYRTQVADDSGARPDIVGAAPDGRVALVLEAKFWAGLTDAQPVAYLKNIPETGALLFVAPAKRFELLWSEVVGRCTRADLKVHGVLSIRPEFRAATVESRRMALVSWRCLLQAISVSVDAAGDSARTGDVRQLAGLCEKMDSEAFLPLTDEELSSSIGRRVLQFGGLIDDLAQRLVTEHLASAKGLKSAAANGWYGRYLRVGSYGVLLHFNSWKWATWGESPIWLMIMGSNWKASPKARDALRTSGIRFIDSPRGSNVAIPLLAHLERNEVLSAAYKALLQVVQALTVSPNSVTASPISIENTAAEPLPDGEEPEVDDNAS
ncbi:MAG: hypothetical protein IPK82_30115 [Polyangiaceae bacterium]|nr:hypothetical protein [Polyangiaceae bacterium]